jgi:subtilisin family serine protease
MSLRVSSTLFAAAALSTALIPAPADLPAAQAAPSTERPRIVFQLRASGDVADAGRVVAERLGVPSWRPGHLDALFARRPPAPGRVDLERVYVAELPPGVTAERAAALLAADPLVAYAQVDFVHETHAPPGDPFYYTAGSWGQPYDDLWALKRVNGGLAMELSRGQGAIVAVVDSGVDWTHRDLGPNIWVNPEELDGGGGPGNGFPQDTIGWDFVSNDNDPRDEFGHGSHAAGVAAAAGDGYGTVGAAPRAQIMAVRAVNGAGAARSSTLAQGIVYAADNGADVILVSSGCVARCPSDPVVESAVRHAFARQAIVVTSAGNRGDDVAFYSPQNMTNPKPIVVGATNEQDQRASGSNIGALLDLTAPGGGTNTPPPAVQPTSNILSVASTVCSPLVCAPAFIVPYAGGGPDRFLRRAGTSMAAAFVAGAVAQILGEDPRLELEDVRARLFGNATDRGPAGWDAGFGWGRLDALASVGDLRRYAIARVAVPASGQVVHGVVRVAGTAAARDLARFEVSVGQGASPSAWSTAGVVAVPKPTAFGELAHWDTTGLAAGAWTIRLVVEDGVLGAREHRRTVTVSPSVGQPLLVVDVDSERGGAGSVQASPPGAFCDGVPASTQTCSYPLATGTTVTLSPVAGDLSHFAGWSGACSGTGACTVPVSEVRYVRATFHGPYRFGLEVQVGYHGQGGGYVDPPGLPCDAGDTCRFAYRRGTPITVFRFEGGPLDSWAWLEGPCEGSQTTLVMDQDHLCKAVTYQVDILNPVSVSAGNDVRAPLGTPATLNGYGFSQAQPLTFTWTDLTNNAFVSDEMQPSVTLAYGVHEMHLRVTDANGESNEDVMLLVVHEP